VVDLLAGQRGHSVGHYAWRYSARQDYINWTTPLT
jgi:hypothetical protein